MALKEKIRKFMTIVFCLTLNFLLTLSAKADRVEIPSSLNPVGSGARAIGMGGAFIAVADDATAASWNPGGLIQLERPEISGVFGYVHRKENNNFGGHPEANGTASFDDAHLNYLSIAYPFVINKPKLTENKAIQKWPERNMVVSLNHQQMYDFNHGWTYRLDEKDSFFTDLTQSHYEQSGALYALGMACCVQISIDLSLGVTLNYWGDFLSENQWKKRYFKKWETQQGTFISNQKETYHFEGWNAHIGFLWRLSEKWTLGGVFKTPFTADIERILIDTETRPSEDDDPPPINETYHEKLHMPMSYGMGVAYRHSDGLTLSADIYRTHWDNFEMEDENGVRTSPITGDKMDQSDIDPTLWFRMGAEYLHIGKKFIIPFRAGIFYDPAPAEGSPDDYYGFSLGTGLVYEPPEKWGFCERLVFDIAYQFRFGEGVGTHMLKDLNFSQDIREHTVFTSLVVHF